MIFAVAFTGFFAGLLSCRMSGVAPEWSLVILSGGVAAMLWGFHIWGMAVLK